MATAKVPEGLTYAQFAAEDLSEKLYYCAKIDTNGLIALAGSGDNVLGPIIESGIAGAPVSVQYGGAAKMICGGTIVAGDSVQCGSDGRIVAATGSPPGASLGIAVSAGVAGRIIEVILKHV